MAYRIRRKDKTVEAAVRRIAREQLGKALASAKDASFSADGIHDVRLSCKKVRALIRLVRPGFDQFAQEDAHLKSLAKRLAPARDLDVLRRLSASLLKTHARHDAERLQALLSSMSSSQRSDRTRPALPELAAQTREQLQEQFEAAQGWCLADDGWNAVGGGLERTYGSAKRKFEQALEQPSSENLHAMRSHSKYHLFHSSLLVRLSPKKMKIRIGKLERLCEQLGDHHDLAMLQRVLSSAKPDAQDDRFAESVNTLIRRQQALLESKALRLAGKLFSSDPGELVDRWGRLWSKWR